MPPHETYIETHLGGGAVLRNKFPASHNIGIDIDPEVIEIWKTQHSHYCQLVEKDAVDYLRKYEFNGDELIYSDPPYPINTRRRKYIYAYDYTEQNHIDLLEILRQLRCMVMVSSYENELYADVLSDWRKITFKAKTHSDIREECVWLNFPVPDRLHDTRFIGSSFRTRQIIKRRQERLKNRVQRMDNIERNEFILWLNKTYVIDQEAKTNAADSFIS
ncbi:hypothetical protein IAD21_03704 [Abditibacteriota bacterium]|nr:hypothetical protein IAD21_03704 [Abditibacteriota bacterium]